MRLLHKEINDPVRIEGIVHLNTIVETERLLREGEF